MNGLHYTHYENVIQATSAAFFFGVRGEGNRTIICRVYLTVDFSIVGLNYTEARLRTATLVDWCEMWRGWHLPDPSTSVELLVCSGSVGVIRVVL